MGAERRCRLMYAIAQAKWKEHAEGPGEASPGWGREGGACVSCCSGVSDLRGSGGQPWAQRPLEPG